MKYQIVYLTEFNSSACYKVVDLNGKIEYRWNSTKHKSPMTAIERVTLAQLILGGL